MQVEELKHKADDELVRELRTLRGQEAKMLADILVYLLEVSDRGTYRDLGHPSMFRYMTDEMCYSGGAAARRLKAVEVLRKNPAMYDQVRLGKINLCALAEVEPILTDQNREVVLKELEGLTRREAERLATKHGAVRKPLKPTIRPRLVGGGLEPQPSLDNPPNTSYTRVTETKFAFTFELGEEDMDLFRDISDFLGASMDPCKVFLSLMKYYSTHVKDLVHRRAAASDKLVPDDASSVAEMSQDAPVQLPPTDKQEQKTRYIPVEVRRFVLKRDGYQCTFRTSEGKRCEAKTFLQMQHVLPHAVGGRNSPEHLVTMCAAHNQLEAERFFGKAFMTRARKRKLRKGKVPAWARSGGLRAEGNGSHSRTGPNVSTCTD